MESRAQQERLELAHDDLRLAQRVEHTLTFLGAEDQATARHIEEALRAAKAYTKRCQDRLNAMTQSTPVRETIGTRSWH